MASSFLSQAPGIIHLIWKLSPKTVLDIGKGFGKYGFLIHEYVGIDNDKRLQPSLSMKEQSNVQIDAVEVDKDLLLPHLSHFYNEVFVGSILDLYKDLKPYDLVLMIDIIEHIPKKEALEIVRHFLEKGSNIIIATPRNFFEQYLYESDYEKHVSHWTINDFRHLGYVDHQYYESGAVYLLSKKPIDVIGFGKGLLKKMRRIARAIKSEF